MNTRYFGDFYADGLSWLLSNISLELRAGQGTVERFIFACEKLGGLSTYIIQLPKYHVKVHKKVKVKSGPGKGRGSR